MKKIIIADSLREFIEQDVSILTRNDNKIFYIMSGQEALDVHRKEKADLMVVELESPDLKCEQLCPAIRGDEALKNVSILIVCSDKLSDTERCQQCGANDYIIQPLRPAEFLRKVLRLLNISERTHYRVIVKVSFREGYNLTHFFCTSQNISKSGILLETEKVMKKGDKITCSFFLPKTVRIITDGEVMRIVSKDNGVKEYGIRFTDISPAIELQIEKFIANWLKKRYR